MAVCAVASFTCFSRAVISGDYENGATNAFGELYGEGVFHTMESEMYFPNNLAKETVLMPIT